MVPLLKTPDNLDDGEDVLLVWRLERLGRSLKDLIELIIQLEERKIGFKSLQDPVDTTSPGSILVFHIFGSLAEFERNLIRERTKAGLTAARARGKKYTIKEICEMMGISRSTLYSYLGERNDPD